jgi:hypothetical protein
MRVRNAVWRPPFVMYYRTTPVAAVKSDMSAAGFAVEVVDLPALGRYRAGSSRCVLVLGRKPGAGS